MKKKKKQSGLKRIYHLEYVYISRSLEIIEIEKSYPLIQEPSPTSFGRKCDKSVPEPVAR